jgi:hypothetical protein
MLIMPTHPSTYSAWSLMRLGNYLWATGEKPPLRYTSRFAVLDDVYMYLLPPESAVSWWHYGILSI